MRADVYTVGVDLMSQRRVKGVDGIELNGPECRELVGICLLH